MHKLWIANILFWLMCVGLNTTSYAMTCPVAMSASRIQQKQYQISFPGINNKEIKTHVIAGLLQHYAVGVIKYKHRGFSQRFYNPTEEFYAAAEDLLAGNIELLDKIRAKAKHKSFAVTVTGPIESPIISNRSGDLGVLVSTIEELLNGDTTGSSVAADLFFTSLLTSDIKQGANLVIETDKNVDPQMVSFAGVDYPKFVFRDHNNHILKVAADEIRSLAPNTER